MYKCLGQSLGSRIIQWHTKSELSLRLLEVDTFNTNSHAGYYNITHKDNMASTTIPDGWDTNQQIRDHQLATSIINGHKNGVNDVFDPESLEILGQFCVSDPLSAREQIAKEKGWAVGPGQDVAEAVKGDLAGYVIMRHGTDDPVLDARDLEMLKEWFEKGMPSGGHGSVNAISRVKVVGCDV
jgi:hypothetical protein